jgi:chromosome segregation ATPase
LPIAGALLLSLAACSDDDASLFEDALPPTGDGPAAGTPAVPGSTSELAALQAELAGIQAKLGPLQNQAMSDPGLQEEFRSLEAAVEDAMLEWDSELPEHRKQLGALEERYRAAQESGNEEETKAIMAEGTSLNAKVQQARSRAMSNPDIVEKMSEFQDNVLARMAEIDPEAKDLIERANAIANQLSSGPTGG